MSIKKLQPKEQSSKTDHTMGKKDNRIATKNQRGKEMNITFIKRRYYDMRLGGTQVSPIIQMANFTMISFMWINHIIPIEIFAPIFIGLGFVTLSYIGVRFRKHQASTDYDMLFEKQKTQAKILYAILSSQKAVLREKFEFEEELKLLKQISEGEI